MKTRAAVLNRAGARSPYAKSRPLAIEELELEGPGYGEVVVKIAAAGLCHSDLSVINGGRPLWSAIISCGRSLMAVKLVSP